MNKNTNTNLDFLNTECEPSTSYEFSTVARNGKIPNFLNNIQLRGLMESCETWEVLEQTVDNCEEAIQSSERYIKLKDFFEKMYGKKINDIYEFYTKDSKYYPIKNELCHFTIEFDDSDWDFIKIIEFK